MVGPIEEAVEKAKQLAGEPEEGKDEDSAEATDEREPEPAAA
jgi:hypothetical protein